jgi:hypothetical protein
MHAYVVQKAQQALTALTRDAPLEDRISEAWAHFHTTSESQHFIEMPPEVRKPYNDFLRSVQQGDPLGEQAQHAQTLIEEVFRADGRGPSNS